MGYYYNELVAPALLHENPGINYQQFNDMFRRHDEKTYLYGYLPIYRLPRALSLPSNKSFQVDGPYHKTTIDNQGLPLYPPFLSYDHETTEYQVSVHVRNDLSDIINTNSYELNKISEGQIIYLQNHDNPYYQPPCLVKKIYQEETVKLNPQTSCILGEMDYSRDFFHYQIACQIIDEVQEDQFFDSEDELFDKWPRFKPENRFDLSTSNGVFYSMNILAENFLWRQSDGRYYFDEKSYDLMPPGGGRVRSLGVGYTDLVVTGETLKQEAVDLPNYCARDNYGEFQSFIEGLPENSKREIRAAIWDAHTSEYAKNKGLSHLELIKFRLSSNLR